MWLRVEALGTFTGPGFDPHPALGGNMVLMENMNKR
jgi:hypothetical protein